VKNNQGGEQKKWDGKWGKGKKSGGVVQRSEPDGWVFFREREADAEKQEDRLGGGGEGNHKKKVGVVAGEEASRGGGYSDRGEGWCVVKIAEGLPKEEGKA